MSTGIANLPEAPTHALRMIDNWCGDSDISFLFAFVLDGAFYDFETGKPVLQYEGDEVLQAWQLTIPATCAHCGSEGPLAPTPEGDHCEVCYVQVMGEAAQESRSCDDTDIHAN
ncbi:hypothetical protein PSYCIT7_007155 [Pseudomonas syringae Cit 7]|uniref:Uncharacterized protein n=1 Tax=Pseudomonas syringae Cit 7 TaxID=629264 RepID=A0A8T8M153_PSESX|nr:hypothetical protein [Pseudomonas syringae]QUP67400.1 hypothetical protein PSYCIT7_007155 [Pseudomonas syringae Cit 7]SDS00990.1 hypothetical protein SAMN05421724_0456 [Pseudomonas syringae]